MLEEIALALYLLSQGPEEYEDMKSLEDSVDVLYWNVYDFIDFGGGPWKIFDNYDNDIAIAFGKPSIKDTVVDTKYWTSLKFYLLPVAIRALKKPIEVDMFREFEFSDASKRLGINWIDNYGKELYEKYNKLKLRVNMQDRYCDVVTVSASRPVKRILPIVVAQTTLIGEDLMRYEPFLEGPIYFNWGRTSFEIDNFDWYYQYYKIKE